MSQWESSYLTTNRRFFFNVSSATCGAYGARHCIQIWYHSKHCITDRYHLDNFLFLQFKDLPLWPKREVVSMYMPEVFKKQYPSTRVIIDATEIFIEQPTFQNYKK